MAALAFGAISCSSTSASKPQATALGPVEVREYKGERLGSSKDFRENSIKGPQRVDTAKYRLLVTGKTDRMLSCTYREVTDSFPLYSKVITLYCVEGWQVKILWEGILVSDLLREAGIDSSAKTVIFTAADGYTTSLPLNYILERNILLAHKMNGLPLRPERGFPFELAAEDKWGYKWIKWVTKIELSSDTTYQGYWERRGYSNEGDLNKGFYEP